MQYDDNSDAKNMRKFHISVNDLPGYPNFLCDGKVPIAQIYKKFIITPTLMT